MIFCIYFSMLLMYSATAFDVYWLVSLSSIFMLIAIAIWENTTDKIKNIEKRLNERSNNNAE